MAQLTEEKLAHIADQSRLYIADDEVASLLDDLNDTISYAEKITKIATDHVKATTNGNQLTNVLREDIPVKWECVMLHLNMHRNTMAHTLKYQPLWTKEAKICPYINTQLTNLKKCLIKKRFRLKNLR